MYVSPRADNTSAFVMWASRKMLELPCSEARQHVSAYYKLLCLLLLTSQYHQAIVLLRGECLFHARLHTEDDEIMNCVSI